MPYGEPLRFTTRGITRVTFVNAAETVRRQCLARTPLADFFRILLDSPDGSVSKVGVGRGRSAFAAERYPRACPGLPSVTPARCGKIDNARSRS